jgi:hypothetical protein
MKRICTTTLVAALAAFGTQASAQPLHESRYEMVTTYQDQNVSFGVSNFQHRHYPRYPTWEIPRYPSWENHNWPKPSGQVIILDKQTGQLWSWYESLQTTAYLGQIFPVGGSGPIARIIEVPEQRTR